jgi:biotin carboxylase
MDGIYPIIIGSDNPAQLNNTTYDYITSSIEHIIKKMGINVGPAMVEIRFDGKDIYPIEINPRFGLWDPVSINSSVGINIAEHCIRFACDIPSKTIFPMEKYEHLGCSIRHLVASGSGVRAVKGVEVALQMPNVKKIEIFNGLFTRFGYASNSSDRIGYVQCVAKTVDESSFSAEKAIEILEILYENKIITYIRYRCFKINYTIKKNLYKIKYRIQYLIDNLFKRNFFL